jgi:hypothetical protein
MDRRIDASSPPQSFSSRGSSELEFTSRDPTTEAGFRVADLGFSNQRILHPLAVGALIARNAKPVRIAMTSSRP